MRLKPLMFLILLLLITACFGQMMVKRTLTSGGQVGGDFYGFAAGQAAQGTAATDYADSAVYGYWTFQTEFVICIDLVGDSLWNVRNTEGLDTIPLHYTASMTTEDRFGVSNCSNCAVDLGLRISDTDPSIITTGYYTSLNRATIRAQLRTDSICPVVYNPTYDWIKDIVTWATDRVFGPDGFNLPPGDYLHIWMQLLTPTYTDDAGEFIDEFLLTVEIQARIYMP